MLFCSKALFQQDWLRGVKSRMSKNYEFIWMQKKVTMAYFKVVFLYGGTENSHERS
jgi:hypothetical protein